MKIFVKKYESRKLGERTNLAQNLHLDHKNNKNVFSTLILFEALRINTEIVPVVTM
jgi:hypothetical protein